jgi:transposase
VALLVSTAPSAICPKCGTPSDRVHSRYRLLVADLPCHDRPIAFLLLVRRFRCVNPGCSQVIFCERLPDLLHARAHSTTRLTDARRAIGFALGGEAGERLTERLGMPTSPDALLRWIKNAANEPAPAPRHVGVDDRAIRKGQRYGTILIDLERGRVIDILEGRDGEALKAWLKGHPGVEIITGDRWAAYAQAAAEPTPQAQQVADRWHLLRNLDEAMERLFQRRYDDVKERLQEITPIAGSPAPAPPVAALRSEKDTNWLSCFSWTDRIIPNPVLNGCDEQQRASSGRRPVRSNTDISAARTSAAPPLADCRKVQPAW